MAIQTAKLGTPPSGVGGDTFRSAATIYNENFSNPAHAASRMVGSSDKDLVERQNIGSAALLSKPVTLSATDSINGLVAGDIAFCDYDAGKPEGSPKFHYSTVFTKNLDPQGVFGKVQVAYDYVSSNQAFRSKGIGIGEAWQPWAYIYTNLNTAVDSNGFIKAASPILKLFADKIDANDEAKQQKILFEKLSPGDYLIKGSSGFAQAGWYIETPKDANGNVLFSVIYETLENGDISVKSYKKKFDLETASIVADLAQPVDIPAGRWIDIRLQELPRPEFEPPASNTPVDFQPTGIAKAVLEMMNGA